MLQLDLVIPVWCAWLSREKKKKSKMGLVYPRYFLCLAKKRRLRVYGNQNKVKYDSQCGSTCDEHFLCTVLTDGPLDVSFVLENVKLSFTM